jgi:4'-phosphopantetheinyl transferase EntD
MRDAPGVCWDRLLFSIKEAAYKAWFPLTARGLRFEDVSVKIDQPCRRFSAHLQVAGFKLGGIDHLRLPGRWLLEDGLLVTAIALPVQKASPIPRWMD